MIKVDIPHVNNQNIALGFSSLEKAAAFSRAILSYTIRGESRLNEITVILINHLKKERDIALAEGLQRLADYVHITPDNQIKDASSNP
jgi:hypothetical protein